MSAGQTTLLAVRTTCKQRTDNVNSSFISDAEWNGYIQSSMQELYGTVVEAYGSDYYVNTTPFSITTDGVNNLFALPSDFFKLLGVDLLVMGTTYKVTLKRFPFAERNILSTVNNQVPMAGQVLNVLYVPRLTVPTLDADAIDTYNGWDELIIADVCIKAMAKEESDTQPFVLAKAAMMERLKSEIENRDAGMPARVADISSQDVRAMRYRLYGNNLWLQGSVTPGWWPVGDWGDAGMGWW